MRLFYGLCSLGQEQRGVLKPPEHPPLATPLYRARERRRGHQNCQIWKQKYTLDGVFYVSKITKKKTPMFA